MNQCLEGLGLEAQMINNNHIGYSDLGISSLCKCLKSLRVLQLNSMKSLKPLEAVNVITNHFLLELGGDFKFFSSEI